MASTRRRSEIEILRSQVIGYMDLKLQKFILIYIQIGKT